MKDRRTKAPDAQVVQVRVSGELYERLREEADARVRRGDFGGVSGLARQFIVSGLDQTKASA